MPRPNAARHRIDGRRDHPSDAGETVQTMNARVRFAPSPTGVLHVGGARTAVFNFLFARHTGGAFLLRIEDTDRERSSDAMTRQILDSLAWLGLEIDEPVVHQADGVERHRSAALALLADDRAYRSFVTTDELARRREEAGARGEVFSSRSLRDEVTPSESERRAAAGEPFAVYFRVPEGSTAWDDVVHGTTRWENGNIDDFVLLRSDGTPVYNLAVVSDDAEMGITHVIRGDDHLSNTPKQILLYEALGESVPTFAHVPLILGPDGRRLSKRHGATALDAYREEGILPQTMVNFLALLGWSPGDDREVMELAELVDAFSLDRILKKSAVFDVEKLGWLNGRHLDRLAVDAVEAMVLEATASLDRAAEAGMRGDPDRLRSVLELVKPRARTIADLAEQSVPYFVDGVVYEEAATARHWKRSDEVIPRLEALADLVETADPYDEPTLEDGLRALAAGEGVGAGKWIHPLRVALVGTAASPGIFEVLVVLGRDRAATRIAAALDYLRETAEG